MDRKRKGKQIAGTGSSSGGKKRKTPGVLQFFEESVEVNYYGGSSDEDCDVDDFLNDADMEDEPEVETNCKDDKGRKGNSSFVFPKEEQINEEEYDRIMNERYKPGSGFVRYADDVKNSIEMDALVPTVQDPPIWKVKCAIGRERHSVFCLMHKFVELRKIGTKLQILSVFFVEHVKGFIFIEADKEHDVLEACKSLNGIYATRKILLPKAEAPHVLTVQRKTKKFSDGTWARIKNGKYKGDLAQVVAVSDTRGKALIKLIPRIDMGALTQKYGGGVAVQKSLNPAPRLISSSELEEFRPLIQVRRDRDTGMTFEHLDSLMLKDGFLYKKVPFDSLFSCGVIPSKEEILKYTPVERKETGDVEWISEIYGEEKKKRIIPTGRGGGKGERSEGEKGDGSEGGKGEGSSESKSESSSELYNLVCFSRKDFGLIVGVDDKGDSYNVLKEGSDGPVVVSVGKKEVQDGPFDSKFSALDLNNKQISINDVMKISKGLFEGKQGVVRQVYRGIIFLYAESEEENGGYFCCKSQSCEKIKLFTEESNEKTGGYDASAFGDSASSPKSPLSPEKEWQPKEIYINSNQGDKGSMYSIGQKLRIRVGPLKGYLCRVIALRYSDVTVKLDSQHKTFTVKSEHLALVRDRNTVLSTSGDAGTGSFHHFDIRGTEGSNGDWAKGAGTSGEGDNWNIGGASTDWSAWGSKPSSDVSSQQLTVPEDDTSTRANCAAENKPASAGDQSGGWSSWGKTPAPEASTVGKWGDAGAPKVEASWGKQGASSSNVKELSSWGKHGGNSDGIKEDDDSTWGKRVEDSESCQKEEESSWGKKGGSDSGLGKGDGESTWGNKDGNSSASNKGVSWGEQDKGSDGNQGGSAWCNEGGGFGSGEKKDGSSGWSKPDGGSSWGKQDKEGSSRVELGGGSSWSKQDGGASWGKKDDGGSSWGKNDKDNGGSRWGKKDDGGSSWGKKDDGGSSWGKENVAGGGSSWGKQDSHGGGSSWGKQNNTSGGSSWGKQNDSGDMGGSNWGKQDGGGDNGFAWGKQNDTSGGSSWGKQNDAGEGSNWGKQDGGGGGSSWGKQDGGGGSGSAWGKQNDGGGASSWYKQGDGSSKPWEEQSGGRGFGGRRGGGFRGGFRGGRCQSGRHGGRSFDRDQSSGWKRDNQENTWKSDQSGGGSDWKKGWGEDSNNRKPSDSSSGGNWASWDTNSKKETNAGGSWANWDTNSKKETNAGDDKPSNENKAAWGTGNDQVNTGNNNDGWNKKPNDDVKTSGETYNAWGGNTNAGASLSSASAWGTGDKKSGW